ncbi:MAG: acetate--CoA ligase [Gammaproteobacteria bacterium]
MLNNSHINEDQYREMYAQSLADPTNFWANQAKKYITWYQPFESVLQGDFKNLPIEWFQNGKLNACYNCVDRHLPKRAEQIAILWEGDEPRHSKQITYSQLHEQVCRLANVLKKFAVSKGDRVCIYMPMIPEVVVAMLACARIGAVHSVIFGGFSPDAIKSRLLDPDCHFVITANEGLRGGKVIPLKKNIDAALKDCPNVKNVLVIKHTENSVSWDKQKDHWYHEEIAKVSADCPCEEMYAQDPLYILYTSGSTGKPKGVLHSTGGYLVYAAMTHQIIFDYQEKEIYWCTADLGWVTGHSYLVYGPLCNGATTLVYEGIPTYPTAARYWEIIDKYNVNIFYTSPTAIRALRREGDDFVKKTQRKSLRVLGTVGEPINPDVWQWYYDVVGNRRCPIVDTWWQTETGGILISPIAGVTPLKPGSAAWPFFGIKPEIVDDKGKPCEPNKMGKLIITQPWPGMLQTIYGNPDRFYNAYFKEFPGNYLTGDDARCDEDGCYWIVGRNDDVLKISGHRIGTGELENAFLQDANVAEAAVVAVPNDIKGESIYAFVTLKADAVASDALKKELIQQVRTSIGAIATPDYIQWAQALPKTRSGKIMRRLLRKIANNDLADLGDTSTLADPQVVESLIKGREVI